MEVNFLWGIQQSYPGSSPTPLFKSCANISYEKKHLKYPITKMPKNEWIASWNTPDEAKTEKRWKMNEASSD